MTRVLFAWELGDNLGHLTRDLPLVRACLRAGHEVWVAACNLRTASLMLPLEGVRAVQAPQLRPARRRRTPPLNYADMLLGMGYDDAHALDGALRAWIGLFELIRPAVVVYNHSPTALLAAGLVGVPVLLVANGFEVPPQSSPLPSFRPWMPVAPQTLEGIERAFIGSVNPYLRCAGQRPLESTVDLFRGQTAHLTTFPELDPFGPRDDAIYLGLVYAVDSAPKIDWEGDSAKRIFAYLRPTNTGVEFVLDALNRLLDAEVICVMPDMPPEWRTRFRRVRFRGGAVDTTALLASADLVVTYGTGTITTAISAGVPVMVVPQVIEQHLTGLALARTGAGRMLDTDRTVQRCTALLEDLLNGSAYRSAARQLSLRHASLDTARASDRLFLSLSALAGPRAFANLREIGARA
jgi:UDP:flavonoid glycosyltransferase YjiC (YdhE family)